MEPAPKPAPEPAPAAAAAKKAAKKATKATEPAAPAARPEGPPAKAWVEGTGAVCPDSHPVKAKMSSHLFHLPGMFAYDRTKPDRCYENAEAAEADGLHRAKR